MKKIFKHIPFQVKSFDDDNFIIRGIFSTGDEDRQGEVIDQNGWNLEEYKKNPVVLFAHDHYQPAIGKMVELEIDSEGNLSGAIQFAAKEYDFAMTIYKLYKGEFMRGFSVGFINEGSRDNGGVTVLIKNTLFEVSAVNVPANAMALAYSKGIDVEPLKRIMHEHKMMQKGVMPYVGNETMPEDTEWDANKEQTVVWNEGDQAKYAKMHAWFDDEADDEDENGYPDVKSAYKLPHHNSDGKVVWKGVAAAMSALLGGRGGVDIPEKDRDGVYEHLAKHYKQFDKEVPEKNFDQADAEDAVGKLSKSNKETILSAIKTLTEVLNAEQEADNKGGSSGRIPLNEGGVTKIPVTLINRAIKELLKVKKL
jgi:HK97 family phage prohead protease